MKTIKENIDLIERYLDEDLDPAELEHFNKKLAQDPDFRQLYQEMELLVEGIRISARKTTLEEKLANLEKSLPFRKSKREVEDTPVISLWERAWQYKGAVAAAVAMLFVATFVLITQDFKTDPGKLYAENFEPFPNVGPGNTRSAEKDDRQRAYECYDRGNISQEKGNYTLAFDNYTQALEIFENLELQTADLLYASNAYMAVGEIGKAEPLLEQVIERGTGLSIHAKWYLALCYLKEEKLDSAKFLFTELKDLGGEDYHLKASLILEKIEKIKK